MVNINEYELKFSVLIPVYNAEKYIKKCIESVVNQVYDNWELIILDDGSTDETLMISENIASQDNRIRVIHQDNKGVSFSRNRLIKESIGDYFIFLDADDWWSSDKMLLLIKNVVASESPDVVCWWTELHDSTGGVIKEDNNIKFKDSIKGTDFFWNVLKTGNFNWWLWLYAFKKSMWMKCGVEFNTDRKICEDEEVLFKVLARAKTIRNIREYFYCYRIGNSESAMGGINEKMIMDMLEVAEKNIKFTKNNLNCNNVSKKILIKNFSSVYIKLGLRTEECKQNKVVYRKIMKRYRYLLRLSLGYMSLSFFIKNVIILVLGDTVGFFIVKKISR